MTGELAPSQRWGEIAALPEENINLAEAALVIAADAYPVLDIDAYLERIDEMGQALRRRLRPDISTADAVIALNHYLFEELGFSGNATDYYDPRNSYLNEVIDRRIGIPITLSLMYIEIGRRIGLALHGVSFPAHFLVKCVTRDGAIVLDPYARGASLSLDELKLRVKKLVGGIDPAPEMMKGVLATAGKREILARMLRNLKGIYLHRNEPNKALGTADRILELAPEAAEELRDRGRIYLDLECFRAALADFQHYVWLKPQAADAAVIRAKVEELRQVAALLN
jgi:regulator of sirC expression with transglutaminase-like and TPR domain